MGRSTPRRRSAKRLSGRFAHGKRNGRNEKFRDVNRFGTREVSVFIGVLFIGYVLIFRPSVSRDGLSGGCLRPWRGAVRRGVQGVVSRASPALTRLQPQGPACDETRGSSAVSAPDNPL